MKWTLADKEGNKISRSARFRSIRVRRSSPGRRRRPRDAPRDAKLRKLQFNCKFITNLQTDKRPTDRTAKGVVVLADVDYKDALHFSHKAEIARNCRGMFVNSGPFAGEMNMLLIRNLLVERVGCVLRITLV